MQYLAVALLLLASSTAVADGSKLSDAQIRQLLIDESLPTTAIAPVLTVEHAMAAVVAAAARTTAKAAKRRSASTMTSRAR